MARAELLTHKSPTSHVIISPDKPSEPIARYHTPALTTFRDMDTSPIAPLRKRGRPPKVTVLPLTINREPSGVSKATSKSKPLIQRRKKPQTRSQTTTKAPKSSSPVSLRGRLQSHRGVCSRSCNVNHN
ncbi:hypothetical protein AVEN_252734-1 [Araneus ventricosus]|uniref:Uncharacterized protein n=1 Tax=Araneus ventricosus TaxID=182803 RepID=A0A4Y2S7E0_ARAVE|nr:hypothetical protein AVEN_197628-1 [Araneus ventricosus]GBN83895.1 hypothetical protein AVEN_252734-1 [Araneus ventricosus]